MLLTVALQHFGGFQQLILQFLIVFLALIHNYLLLFDFTFELVNFVEEVLNMIRLLELFEHQSSVVLLLSLDVEDVLLNLLDQTLVLQITNRLLNEQHFISVCGTFVLPLVQDLLERLK
jgi:hypothetical protein